MTAFMKSLKLSTNRCLSHFESSRATKGGIAEEPISSPMLPSIDKPTASRSAKAEDQSIA